jgi:hypothetical protein
VSTYEITAKLPRSHDTFVSRTTNIDGRTFRANAVEFWTSGEPTKRISLDVHPRTDDDPSVGTCLISGKVSIDIGDLSVWLPEGYEAEVAAALNAAIEEQARQAEAGTLEPVVSMTGDDPKGFRGWDNDDEVSA